jgi:hypothetical protein
MLILTFKLIPVRLFSHSDVMNLSLVCKELRHILYEKYIKFISNKNKKLIKSEFNPTIMREIKNKENTIYNRFNLWGDGCNFEYTIFNKDILPNDYNSLYRVKCANFYSLSLPQYAITDIYLYTNYLGKSLSSNYISRSYVDKIFECHHPVKGKIATHFRVDGHNKLELICVCMNGASFNIHYCDNTNEIPPNCSLKINENRTITCTRSGLVINAFMCI